MRSPFQMIFLQLLQAHLKRALPISLLGEPQRISEQKPKASAKAEHIILVRLILSMINMRLMPILS